jgi:exodeoxyribonuclease III
MPNTRIISYNLNGIRAAMNKGLMDWLKTNPADIFCVQETKAHKDNVDHQQFTDLGFAQHWFSAEKKGYSGVAIFSKKEPDDVIAGNGFAMSDAEGRVIRADFGKLTVINAYFPSGTSGDERQTYKYQWLEEFQEYIDALKLKRKQLVVLGDYNIAHKEIDIHDPKGNKKSSGFLPEERDWMDKWLAGGMVDSFRHMNQEPHHYSWWSQRFPTVRLQNKGWRIDYISVTENLKKNIVDAKILPDVKHSDHCPIYLELNA